jgi:hypothetical protein
MSAVSTVALLYMNSSKQSKKTNLFFFSLEEGLPLSLAFSSSSALHG